MDEPPPPLEPRTLSGVLDELTRRGFAEHFRVLDSGRLRALDTGGTFGPSQVSIPECHRFEGVSDPDDMSILCAIETHSGLRGTLVDAFGVYSDPLVGDFLKAVPETLMDASVDELLTRQVARFVDRRADWDAFADARVEGFRRAQHGFIGAGASGKKDPHAIPAEHFTLSIMLIPPGQGNAAHTHEVEEVFFVLRGTVMVFFEDAAGRRAEAVLGEWDCVSAPANVIHGFQNVGLEPAYMQVMLGRATPDLMQYADAGLQARRDEHLKAR